MKATQLEEDLAEGKTEAVKEKLVSIVVDFYFNLSDISSFNEYAYGQRSEICLRSQVKGLHKVTGRDLVNNVITLHVFCPNG